MVSEKNDWAEFDDGNHVLRDVDFVSAAPNGAWISVVHVRCVGMTLRESGWDRVMCRRNHLPEGVAGKIHSTIEEPPVAPITPPSDIQYDGDHYKKMAIQPIHYCHRNRLDVFSSFAIKHITRHEHKGEGVTDLKKAIHYLQMCLEEMYGVQSEVKYSDAVEQTAVSVPVVSG